MKSFLPLLTFAVILSSCSSVYKSGQTPDDVYYSPARQRDEYVRVEEKNDRMYGNDETAREDRYLRMKTRYRRYDFLESNCDCYSSYGRNYYRYNDYYRMNSYAYNNWMWNNQYGYYNYNPYYYNPYYGNPYYTGVVYGNVNPVYNKPRTTNLHVYDGNGNTYNSNLPKSNGKTYSNSSSENDNYRGSGSNAGGFLRNVFGNGNSNSSNTSSSSNTTQSSTNSSSNNNSSSSSSGSGHASTRKF